MLDASQLTKTVAMLKEPLDWHSWFKAIKNYAKSKDVWEYCDPQGDLEHDADIPEPSKEEKVLNQHWYRAWRDEKLDAQSKRKDILAVSTRIIDTIASTYNNQLPEDADSPRKQLQSLQQIVGYTDEYIETLLEAEYRRLSTLR